VQVQGGALHKLSAWYRATSASGFVSYSKIWWYDVNRNPIFWPMEVWNSVEPWVECVTPGPPGYCNVPGPTTFGWRRYEALVRPPDAARYATVTFIAGIGTTLIDDVALTPAHSLPRISSRGEVPRFVSYSDVVVDPTDVNTLYTGTLISTFLDIGEAADVGGIWKTSDGGTSWNHVTRRQWHDNVQDNGTSAPVCGDNVCEGRWETCGSCPIDCPGPGNPYKPATACCGDGICSSATENYNNCLVDCPFDPDTIARPYYEVDKYYNQATGNYYWSPTGNGFYPVWSIGIGSGTTGHNTLQFGAERLRSTDGGNTWVEVSSNINLGSGSDLGTLQGRGDTTDVFIHPIVPDMRVAGRNWLLYGDTDNQLQISYNGGTSFRKEGWQWSGYRDTDPSTVDPGVTGDAASSIVLDPSNTNRIYAGVFCGAGNVGYGNPQCGGAGGAVIGDYTAPDSSSAVGKWTWTPLGTQSTFPKGGGVDLIRTKVSGTFYASVFGSGVYKLTGSTWSNAGQTWAPVPAGYKTYRIIEEPTSGRLYVGAGEILTTNQPASNETGIWESNNGGVNWCRISNHTGTDSNMDKEPIVNIRTAGPNTLFAAARWGYQAQGVDGSGNWTGDGGIYKGTRIGDCNWSWVRVLRQPETSDIVISPMDNSIQYAFAGQICCGGDFPGQKAGIHKSTNGGSTWTLMTNNGLMNVSHGRLEYAAGNPLRFYAGTIGDGLFEGTVSCTDNSRDFECATRINPSVQSISQGTVVSGAYTDLTAGSPDDTYEVLKEGVIQDHLSVTWTLPGALTGVPYALRLEGFNDPAGNETLTFFVGYRASGTCDGTEAYTLGNTTFSGTSDLDQVQSLDIGALPAGNTVFCVRLKDGTTNNSNHQLITIDRLYLMPYPPDVVAAADQSIGPGTIFQGTFVDTQTSNDVREILKEALNGNTSNLTKTWRFDNVPAGSSHKLHLEGNRPNNPDNDNFQFSYSTDGINFTDVAGAILSSPLEQQGGADYSVPSGTGGTWYIRVKDTDSTNNKTSLDTVAVEAA
jgi:hypothetical protein